MSPVPFDTFEAIQHLTAAGFTDAQAHAVSDLLKQTALVSAEQLVTKADLADAVGTLQATIAQRDGTLHTDLAHLDGSLRSDLARVDGSLRTEITRVEGSLRTEIATIHSDLTHLKWGLSIGASVIMGLLLVQLNGLWQLMQKVH